MMMWQCNQRASAAMWPVRLIIATMAVAVSATFTGTRVEAALARRGGEFRLNSSRAGGISSPQVASMPDGGFFVVWQNNGDIIARRFDSASESLGLESIVNQTSPDTAPGQRVAASSNGSVLVVWSARARRQLLFPIDGD